MGNLARSTITLSHSSIGKHLSILSPVDARAIPWPERIVRQNIPCASACSNRAVYWQYRQYIAAI